MVSLSRHISLASVTGLALLCLVSPVWAADGRVQAIQYNAASRHFQINAAGSLRAVVNTLNVAGHKRIIIDLDNAEIGTELPRDVQLLHALSRQMPTLKNVTVNQYAGNGRPIVRILIDIQGDPGTVRLVRNQGSQIELAFNESANNGYSNYAQPPSLSRLNPPQEPAIASNQQSGPTPPVYGQNTFSEEDLRRTLSVLNSKYENLVQENQYLKSRLNNAEQSQNNHLSGLEKNREEQNRLKADVDRLSSENANLQSQLNSLRLENQRPDPALSSQQAEIARLKSDNQSLNTQLSAALSRPKGTSVDEMKQSLAEINRRYDKLAQENQTLRSRLETQANQTASFSANKTQLERLTQENQDLNANITRLKADLQKNTAVAANKTQLDRLTQENQDLNANITRLKADLQKNTTNAKSTSAVSDTEFQTLRKQLTVAQGSLSDAIRTINEQNKEIAYLRNQVNTVQAGMDGASKEQVSALQAEIAQLKKGTQSNSATQKELANAKAELESLKRSTASNKGSAADKQTIALLNREKQTLQDDLDSLKMAQQQNGNSTQKAEQLESQLNTLQSDLSSLKLKYSQALQEAAQAKESLKLASTKTKPGTISKPDAGQQPALDNLNQQLSALRQENKALKETISATPVNRTTSTNTQAERDYNLAKTALSEKKIEMALSKFKEALLLDADNAKYATDYSIALAEDKQYGEAIDVLRRYLQRNPGDRDAYNQLGKVYLLNDQADAANQAFTRAIPLSVLNNYATSLKKVGNIAEAESVFKLALTINPKDSEVLFNLGNLYNAENKLEEARNKYLEAIQARPGFAEAHYNVGLIFSKLGDNAQAVTHLEKYLQLSPNARNAETIRTYMQKLKA
ncbi:tetratricopeptide repeat protein [Vampirovibrio sp.]|uniref:tetratricopeptide repeat protein n=1 Tax=Vampirovibrio sp. TaxID=2717857 RepID=UPI003593A363